MKRSKFVFRTKDRLAVVLYCRKNALLQFEIQSLILANVIETLLNLSIQVEFLHNVIFRLDASLVDKLSLSGVTPGPAVRGEVGPSQGGAKSLFKCGTILKT